MHCDRKPLHQSVPAPTAPRHTVSAATTGDTTASQKGHSEPVHHADANAAVRPVSTDPHHEISDGHHDDGTHRTDPAAASENPDGTAEHASPVDIETIWEEWFGQIFFADEEEFLQYVFKNWAYFLRVLGGKYSLLVEQEREIGTDAPVGTSWHVSTDVPRADRDFEAAIGSCDAEEIIIAAIKRCTKPTNKSFYANYTPTRNGKRVKFTSWFVSRLRSIAGSRIRSWKRRPWEDTIPEEASHAGQDERERFALVDTFMCPKRPARETPEQPEVTMEAAAAANAAVSPGESVEAFVARGGRIRRVPDAAAFNFPADFDVACAEEMRQHADTKPTERPGYGDRPSYRRIEARLDIKKLSACLTEEQREIRDVLLAHGGRASKQFAKAIKCEYSQARSQASYLRKKMRGYAKELDGLIRQDDDIDA